MEGWTFVSLVGLAFLIWFVLVFLFTSRIDFQVAAGQVACLSATGRGIELLWHAQKDAPVAISTMVASR